MRIPTPITTIVLSSLGLLLNPLQAVTTVLNDTFDVGAGTLGNDPGDPLDTAWYRADSTGGLPALSVVTDSGSRAMFVEPTNTAQPLVGSFAAVTLSSINDYIELSGTYRTDDQIGGGMRFGLFYDSGTPTIANNDGSADDDIGYKANIGTPSGSATGTSTLTYDNGPGDVATTDTVLYSITGAFAEDFAVHTWRLRITLTGASELTLFQEWSGSSNGTSTLSGVVTTDLITTYNEAAFAWGATTGSGDEAYYLDNITVTTNTVVPEPSHVALMLGCAGLVFVYLRKRRS